MRSCPTCGAPFSENDNFCSRCGTTLRMQPPTEYSFPILTPKPSSSLINGLMIGSGLALLIVGLIIAFALNGIYNQQINYLATQGIQVSRFGLGLNGIILLISLCTFLAVFGTYYLILGVITQFSSTVRTAMERKDGRARLGNGFVVGGFALTAISSANVVEQIYRPSYTGRYGYVETALLVLGLLLILAGALLIRNSYLRSRLPTKV